MQGICQLCHKVSIDGITDKWVSTVLNGFHKTMKTPRANCTFSKELKGL